MSTKIVAARLATAAGVTTVITRSSNPGNIVNIVRYLQSKKTPSSQSGTGTPALNNIEPALTPDEDPLSRSVASLSTSEEEVKPPLHTRFLGSSQPIRDRYFWLLHGLAPHGTLYIDIGAHKALLNKAGLLPVGVVDVDGTFGQHEAVRLVVVDRNAPPSGVAPISWEGQGIEVGRALVNYNSTQIACIKGVKSSELQGLLGYADSEYVALRENISFFTHESRPATPSLDRL